LEENFHLHLDRSRLILFLHHWEHWIHLLLSQSLGSSQNFDHHYCPFHSTFALLALTSVSQLVLPELQQLKPFAVPFLASDGLFLRMSSVVARHPVTQKQKRW
jgi:hypothetical protein